MSTEGRRQSLGPGGRIGQEGLLYSAFTYYTGFKVNGTPRYAGLTMDNLIDVKPDGSFTLDLSYFD